MRHKQSSIFRANTFSTPGKPVQSIVEKNWKKAQEIEADAIR